ncbi:ribonuclease HI [Leptolyngbyaceae cyanobacterium JSC-12]|nr:ribonuclease HI [Leptolyngbyaceae cyanobacterium JSC-12]
MPTEELQEIQEIIEAYNKLGQLLQNYLGNAPSVQNSNGSVDIKGSKKGSKKGDTGKSNHLLTYPSIYIDGACQSTEGGWGVVVYLDEGVTLERGGYVADTTCNRMELQAAIEAVRLLQQLNLELDYKVPVYTDSQYVQKGITIWINNWKRNGWQGSSGEVKNVSLWVELDTLNKEVLVDWRWVKGHIGVQGNERADFIATAFAAQKQITLHNSFDLSAFE